MRTSEAGIELIQQHEGFRSNVYKDAAGRPTIGYGHLLKPGESFPHGVTQQQATELLRADLAIAEEAVNRLVKVKLDQNQFDSLCSWTFNLGAGNLQASSLLARLNKRDYEAVPSEMRKWIHAGGEVVPGLVARRDDEADLWSGEGVAA
jgi:lysozyme